MPNNTENTTITANTPRTGDTNIRVNLHRARGLLIDIEIVDMIFNDRPTRYMTELHSVRRMLDREIAADHVSRYIPEAWPRAQEHRDAYADILVVYTAEILAQWIAETGSTDEALLEAALQHAPRRCLQLQLERKKSKVGDSGANSSTSLEPQPQPQPVQRVDMYV